MANQPSHRTHRQKPMEGLNLTPFIDMITCLMFFLMMFASVIPVTIIDAPLPKVASTADEVRQAKDNKNKFDLSVIINTNALVVKAEGLGDKSFAKQEDGQFPYAELHKHLLGLKQRKPDSHELTLMPSDDTPYDVMIQVMDASREVAVGDPGYQAVPPDIASKPESAQFNRLFPDVSIGGV